MNNLSNIAELVSIDKDKPVTDSLRVAEFFGKEHYNVLRAFDNLGCSEEFNQLNYEVVDFIDKNGESRRMLKMTFNGFIFLAMGFTGKRAAQVKEAYINAFNAMAVRIKEYEGSLWERVMKLEVRDKASFRVAQVGSKFMLDRKKDLKEIRPERNSLMSEIQPSLPFVDNEGVKEIEGVMKNIE
jgi:Rha family phage regulatory protein